ncbi:FAD/NAD-P-binding domain-containing protein [Pilatotrama ljubarskyi]|nr:FAD/NAD-P-binding domain-containing protein [Pilatotrama ljubarskyi]
MSHSDKKRFRVAIIGAGLGGLLLALFMQKNAPDVEVTLYESTSVLTEIGAGIGFWPRMWEILTDLGLEDDLLQITGAHNRAALPMHYRKADQSKAVDFYQLSPALFTFHRSDLQRLLAKHLHAAKIHFSKRLSRYQLPQRGESPIALRFRDGTSADCDLLIGSDGIKSAVRRTMYESLADEAARKSDLVEAQRLRKMADPVWSREVAYRGLAPATELEKRGFTDADVPIIFYGKNKHALSYPICRGKVVNVVAFVSYPNHEAGAEYEGPWVSTATAEEAVKQFAGWDPSVQTLLGSTEKPLRWAIHECHYLPTYVRGRVALIGDAAHAMRPHQGAGAGQALEDGFILATILAQASVTRENLTSALKVYDAIRRPAAQDVQRRSEANGRLYQLNAMGWENVTEEESKEGGFSLEKLAEIGKQVERQMSWTLGGSVMVDRDRAVAMLQRKLTGEPVL